MHPPNRRRPQHPPNRRLARPSQNRAVARRNGPRLQDELRRRLGAGLSTLAAWVRAIPRVVHDSLAGKPEPEDSAVLGEPRTWDRHRSADTTLRDTPDAPSTRERSSPLPSPWDTVPGDTTTWASRRAAPAESGEAAAESGNPAPTATWTPRRTLIDGSDSVARELPPASSAPHVIRPADRTIVTQRVPPVGHAAPPQPAAAAPAPPTAARQATTIGRRLIPQATAIGRRIAPHAAEFGRQLGPLARRGARMTGRGVRIAGRQIGPMLRLLRRFLAAVGEGTMGLGGALARLCTGLRHALVAAAARHRGLLFGLFTRAMWWSALVLLLLGGQALVEIHGRAPLDQRALPAFALGLGLCALLVTIAAQARLRWAALVLGFSHGGLLALVWVVAAAIH